MRLRDLIEQARSRGHDIVYSTDTVHDGLRAEAGDGSLDALRAALPALGLTLQREGDFWLIRPGPLIVSPPAAAQPAMQEPENLIVTGTRYQFPENAGAGSARRLAAAELAATPSLASDLMRTALRLPGISSVGISAKPHIRGGLQDELLILQDGIELLEPFHLADYHSAYSTLDYQTVEAVDFYTGGFPSRYGNRMSGVMDISNHWTARDFNTDLGVSSFTTFVNTRGKLSSADQGDWGLSYRRGDLSDLTDYLDTRSGNPEYQDAALRLRLQPGDRTGLSSGLVFSEDDIRFGDVGERAASRVDSWYGWIRLDHAFSERLQTRLALSGIDLDRRKILGNAEIEDDPEDPGSFLAYRQQVSRLGLRQDVRWLRRQVFHEFGWQFEWNDAAYDNNSRIDRGDLADVIGTQRYIARDIHLEPDGFSGGVYWAGEWQLGDRWLLQPGLRWDWQDYYAARGARHQWSPRLGIAFEIAPDALLRLSIGRFHQPEGIQELQVLDGVERFFKPQRSDQVVAGLEWAADDWQLVLESYFKRYRATKGRFENVFNPFVLLPEMESDRIGLFPDQARAYGFDLDLGFNVSATVTATFRYSYMQAEDELDGDWIDRRWSQTRTANAGLAWQGDNFSVALALVWHTGWRSTLLPSFIAEDEPIEVLDYLNNRELRDHIAIDVSARYAWNFPRARLEVYADISNLTDRRNQAGIDFDEEEIEGGYRLTPDRETLLGRVPSVGITLSF